MEEILRNSDSDRSVASLRHESAGDEDLADDMISSNSIEGRPVLRTDGTKIGRISHFVFSQSTGQVKFAILNFGSFLDMGEEHRPVPWEALRYDAEHRGYVLPVEDDTIRKSPRFGADDEPTWDREYAMTVYSYFGSQS